MTPTWAEQITVEMLDADPYPIYARLRAEAPVCWVPAVNIWFVTRWDDVEYVGQHPEIFGAEVAISPVDYTFGSPTVITCDGATHKDLRRALDPKYRPRKVDAYIEGLVRPLAETYLEKFASQGQAELMADYFEPISVLSLAHSLGLGEVDAATLRRWFFELAQGATNFERNPEKQVAGDRVSREIDDRLAPVLAHLEQVPDDSALAHMLHAGMEPGQTRAREFLMPSIKVILLGGMQEPGHGAGSTLYALLLHPEQAAEVATNPAELVPKAVDEGMRWIAPIGTQTREVKQPVTLGGVTLEPGAPIASLLSSANRDERRFRDPDRFDIHRDDIQHAAFGFGPHYCTGHWFARQQERIALQVLFEHLPDLRLNPAQPPELRGWEFRAPAHLHVLFTPR